MQKNKCIWLLMHIRFKQREEWIPNPSLFTKLKHESSPTKNSKKTGKHSIYNRNIIITNSSMFHTSLKLTIITTFRTLRLGSNYNNNMSSITCPIRWIHLLFLKRWNGTTNSSRSTCLLTTATSTRWCDQVNETKFMIDTASPASTNNTSGTGSMRKLCTDKPNTTYMTCLKVVADSTAAK